MQADINKDFAAWYQEAVLSADLADYGPVRGTIIFKPYGYALWKKVQNILGKMINEELGAEDVYFPSLIPYEFLSKEKEHVEGFAPEVAVVTHAGGKKLDKPVVIRPTSETVMYDAFARWIESYKDLPLKVNQWVNIVRWEKRTVLFLRSSEFLWQEGHTVHATESQADSMVMEALSIYDKFLRSYMAIPGIKGYKTNGERFAGALYTTTIEVLLKSRRALQIATSHNLGQGFAKAFGIKYVNKYNKEVYPWQTSWGLSTRSLGGLIGLHGDEKGVVFPPYMAPIPVVIIPIFKGEAERLEVAEYIAGIEKMLKGVGIKFKTDWSDNTPGWKFNHWEAKGVPLRIEVGLKEVKKHMVKCVSRVDGQAKSFSKGSKLYKYIEAFLDEIQAQILARANTFLNEHITEAQNEKELEEILHDKGGFIKVFFKDDDKKAEYLQAKYKITPRVVPLDTYSELGHDFITGEKGARLTLFAKAY